MKYRIVKIITNQDPMYFVQKKKFFSGWHTMDWFSTDTAAYSYLMRHCPNVGLLPNLQAKIIYEGDG